MSSDTDTKNEILIMQYIKNALKKRELYW